MKIAWQVFKKHPISIFFYLFYSWIIIRAVLDEIEYEKILKQNGGKWPYGVREGGLLPVMFTMIFLFMIIINAIIAREKKFYLWLILFILLPWLIAILFPNF